MIMPSEGPSSRWKLLVNLDMGFIKLGQQAGIKVDAFPFTRFGVLHGKAVKIASGAVDEQAAKRRARQRHSSANATPAASTARQSTPNIIFPVTIALDTTTMKADNATIPLTPGMTVTVEIKTDSRRVIDYLLSPIAKIASEAMKER